ncbi:MAG: hypothetical protein OXH96_05480 [Spirochaetaceae bacterium]|nr:hypothetical protein [Spirochaetaceae bacterium]
MTFALLGGVIIAIYILYRTFRKKPDPPPTPAADPDAGAASATAPAPDAAAATAAEAGGEDPESGVTPFVTADVVPDEPSVNKQELVEMIDSLIEQYEEEIREMTPAQVRQKKASWEQIENLQQITQIEFAEEVIERFWGYRKGSTPEISNVKKLSLGRGVWYTTRLPGNE